MALNPTVKSNDGTMSERCIARSNTRIQESGVLIENSRVTRLASIAAFKLRRKQKAAAAKAKRTRKNQFK
jgi:hypothetical protein